MRQNYNHPEIQNIVTCNNCGKTFTVCYNTFRSAKPGKIWLCRECMKKLRAARMVDRMNNPEYVKNLSQKRAQFLKSLSTDEKERRRKLLIEGQKKWFNSLTDDELMKIRENLSRNAKKRWDLLSDEDKNSIKDKLTEYRSMFWDSMTPEERSNFVKSQCVNRTDKRKEEIRSAQRERWKNLSEYEKDIIRSHLRNGWNNMPKDKKERFIQAHIDYYNNLSQEEKEEWARRGGQYWDDLLDEEKIKISNQCRENDSIRFIRNYYESLSQVEKDLIHRNSLITGKANKLTKQFEKSFDESILSNHFVLTKELVTSNEFGAHSWDYGIFTKDTNELVMVVDLDGSYFHADKCDYDGLHSKEEYDEKRSLTVSPGIKIFIIIEDLFSKSFSEMIKSLMLHYDEFIENMFKECRLFGFPYINYTDNELLRSYESLRKMNCNDKYHKDVSLNTRLGDRLIQYFHQSIWHAHVKGKPSPYDAWNDDKLLRKVIENRTIYQNHLNPNKILQGFNVSKVATKVSVFSAGRAKLIINKYLSEYNTIFDPFSGFSGRMLGAASLGKRYIGQDISEIHVNESNDMINFLRKYRVGIDAIVMQCDSYITTGTYPCLFTCPPYGDKEVWIDSSSTLSCDDWIDICLKNFRCDRYVFVVGETSKYKDYIKDIISNRSHFNKNQEYVIVI